MSKDWSHLVEAIGKGIWVLSFEMEDRLAMENSTFRITAISWLDFPSICLLYQLCYTHRQYFDSFGNFRVFSILICHYMHILASGHEKYAV